MSQALAPLLSQHPIFQTLALPLLLALLGMAALRLWPGERWALCGAMLGLVGALAWMPGFEWPAQSRTAKLPWVVLAGLCLALLALAREVGGVRLIRSPLVTLVAVAVWVWAGLWLSGGQASPPLLLGAGLLGGAVLWLLARGHAGVVAPAAATIGLAVLAVAALGLAALAATGGSLLLAQLAGMLATTAMAGAGWSWLRPSARMAAAGGHWLWPLGLTWLSIAWTWVLAAPAPSAGYTRALQVALLALAFGVPVLMSSVSAAALEPRWKRLVLPGLVLPAAALLAAVAVALAWWAGVASMGGTPMPDTATDPNDPYLTP